jgi:hypothetical protein
MSDSLLKLMDAKLDKIQESITELKIDQAKQEVNLIANTKQLEEHMHRSDLLEESQEVLYEEVSNIKLHKAQMDGILKFLGILSTIVSVAVGLLKLFHKI